MGESEEIPGKFLSVSSSENRESTGSLNDGGDEEFYEEIEAPKFVDFTVPDHYCPDDRYWFCLRVGCDHKHEEEMDSEAIYKNFVLRVMAARSPNVRLRKALDRNASRTPIKCPMSAPPKSSKPSLSRMAVISSFSKKMAEDKKKVVRPILKLGSTPVTKTKPVAAKYLTTPRNKKCISEQSSFRSVQHPKPISVDVPKSRIVAKALVFRSPKKAIKVKTSAELRTPISKLCQGMNRLEISSQRKRVLGNSLKNSSDRRQLSSQKLQSCKGEEATKSGKTIGSKIKGQLLQPPDCKKNDIRKQTESGPEESSHKEAPTYTNLPQDDLKREVCIDLEGKDESRSPATKAEDNTGDENIITSETCVTSENQLNGNNSSQEERSGVNFEDGDNKENAAASDMNRIPNNTLKKNGRKIFGVHEKCDQVRKKVVTQAQEGSCGPATKLKKPKATNPKPFRLRTDERGILKEAVSDKRVDDAPASQSENGNVSTPGGKLQRKSVNDIQKGSTTVVLKTPKGKERSKSAAAASITPENNKNQERRMTSNAMQRLEKFRKLKSPLPKPGARPQGLVPRKQELISYLIPGKKLDVIHETSPEVSEPQSRGKPRSGRRLITVGAEPRTCTKKL